MEHKPTFIYICTTCAHNHEIDMSAVEIPTKCLKCGVQIPTFRVDQNKEQINEKEAK
jgi:DNA-directed RNA polymerase subunit RPC12/RpoP